MLKKIIISWAIGVVIGGAGIGLGEYFILTRANGSSAKINNDLKVELEQIKSDKQRLESQINSMLDDNTKLANTVRRIAENNTDLRKQIIDIKSDNSESGRIISESQRELDSITDVINSSGKQK